jgi:heat shock protein HslJ
MHVIARFLLLVLALGSFGACSSTDLDREAHPTTLAGTAWRVVSINGQPAIAGSEPTAAFAAGEVQGSSGCNSYGGPYTYEPATGAIAFGQLSMTLMLCEPQQNEVETLFTATIPKVTVASIDPDGRLVLTGPAAEIVLTVAAVGS